MTKGLIDRFRSLPMARSAVLSGRTFADILYGTAGPFANLPDRFVGSLADFADRFAGAFRDRFQRVRDLLQDVWVAVEGGQDPVDDRGHMVEPRPQQGLGFDAFEIEFNLAELGMDADTESDQVENLGVE